MSEFQKEFFEELWHDTTANGRDSVLYEYLREDKRSQVPAVLKRLEYEELLGEDVSDKRLALMKTKEYADWEKAEKKAKTTATKNRKKAIENPCVDVICKYYDYKIKKLTWAKEGKTEEISSLKERFLDEIERDLEGENKIAKKEKREPLSVLSAAKENSSEALMEDALNQVIGAYLSVDAKQFMYDIGYPLTAAPEVSKRKGSQRVPVKRVPMKLMDMFFRRRNISIDGTGGNAESICEKAKPDSEIYDEFEQVYSYVRENKMVRAVIPLLLDNQSGSGLYIVGEEYLEGFQKGTKEWEKLQDILTIGPKKRVLDHLEVCRNQTGKSQANTYIVNKSIQPNRKKREMLPCCYAIVKFMNLNLYEKNEWEDKATYYWSPYSIAASSDNMENENVDEVIFSDLHKAIDCYHGHLKTEPDGVKSDLYEYFRDVNMVDKDSDWQFLPKRFWKYFDMEDDFFKLELERAEAEMEYEEMEIEERIPNRINLLQKGNPLI